MLVLPLEVSMAPFGLTTDAFAVGTSRLATWAGVAARGPSFLHVLWSAESVALTVRLTERDWNCDCACDRALPRWYGEGQQKTRWGVGAEQLCVAAPVFGDSAYYS